MVVRTEPFHKMKLPPSLTNPAPFTVSRKDGPPTIAEDGFSEKIAGKTEKPAPPELPLMEKTLMLLIPESWRSVAGIEALSWVELKKVVGRLEPFHRTMSPELKPVPLTVRLKPGPPAAVDVGETLLTTAGRLCAL